MRRDIVLAIGILLVSPVLAGCLGFGGEDTGSSDGLETKSRAEVSEQTGGVEGVVTDSAVQPVQGATVEVVELGESTTSKDDGSFAFSNIQPGTYTLQLSKEGFIGTEKAVDVSSGAVSTVEIVLAHEPTIQPFSQTFSFEGFLECSIATPVVLVAVCSIPPFLINQVPGADGDNATNDRFIFFHPIEENPWQLVTEMDWEPNQPLAREMALITELQGLSNDDRTQFGEDEGEGPLIVRSDRARFAHIVQTAEEVCAGEQDPGGIGNQSSPDAYCNRNFIENGGNVQIRVFVSNRDTAGAPSGGAAIQQDFTVIQSIFYNTPACEDFSVFEGNECDQQDSPPAEDPYAGSSSGDGGTGSGGNRSA